MKIKLFEEWGYLDKYYEEISYDDFDISDDSDYNKLIQIRKCLIDMNSGIFVIFGGLRYFIKVH